MLPNDYSDTLVIIPALNEAATILDVLDEVKVCVPGCGVVVVDSHSTDGMTEMVEDRGIEILQTLRGGKGLAVQCAFAELVKRESYKYWVMVDGDLTYPARYIPIVVAYLRDGADVVLGHRNIIADGAMTRINRIGNKGLSLIASSLYGMWVHDVCTGMWGFTREAAGEMRLSSRGFTLEADMFTNAIRQGSRVEQIPVSYRARPDGSRTKLTMMDGFKIGWFLLANRWG